MTPQQQMILDSFNSEVYVSNRMDVQHTPLYDTIVITAGNPVSVLTSAFFTNVGPASGKTFALTNMSQSQKLPAPEAFSIYGVRLRFAENISLLDIFNLMDGFAFELFLGQKPYQRGPIWYFNAGGGIWGIAPTTATSTLLANGVPGRGHMHKLAINVVIENQMTFYGQLNGTTYTLNATGTGLFLMALLDGLYARGVQ